MTNSLFNTNGIEFNAIGYLAGGLNDTETHLARLEQVSRRAKSVKGAIAFWTCVVNDIPEFSKLLGASESYICIDPSYPTNLEALGTICKVGGKIFLYRYGIDFEYKDALLHSKLLLFDLDDYTAELWVGSHNITKRALKGINIEHSIVIKIEKASVLYKSIDAELNFIREKQCVELNDSILQGAELEDTIVLFGPNMRNLTKEEVILLLFQERNDAVKKINKKVFLLGIDTDDASRHLYKAVIRQSGELKGATKLSEITFDYRRYGVKDRNMATYLFPESRISSDALRDKQFFVNINIHEKISSFNVLMPSGDTELKTSEADFFGNRFNEKIAKRFKINEALGALEFKEVKIDNSELTDLKSYYELPPNDSRRKPIYQRLSEKLMQFLMKFLIKLK
ncbi:MAG: hypothetical protein IPK08_11860 [Bacteroidetes bacterium]|nr:hypothetical protein [Bacteroidota bacterium]